MGSTRSQGLYELNVAGKTMKKLNLYPIHTFIQMLLPLLAILVTTNTHASYWETSPQHTSYSPVTIDIIKDHGRALHQYSATSRRNHVRRTYLEAEKGSHYSIRVRNTSNRRVGLVIAVDGRNILTGKKSWLGNHEKMYILDPYETSTYTGWRTAKNQVNRFYFTSSDNSYADAWGDRTAMGVIAIAVYEEKHREHYYNKKHKESSPKRQMGKSRSGYLAEESAGTGFGEEEYSPTVRVTFKAKNKPIIKQFIKYEWRESLCKRGVINCHNYRDDRDDNRFWPEDSNHGYAPYPPGYYRSHGANGHWKGRWSDQFKRGWNYSERGW